MDPLLNDLRHAIRLLTKTRAVSLVAILALGVGIGLTTAMFSIVYGVVLRGLPFRDSSRIMHVHQQKQQTAEYAPTTVPDYLDYARRQKSFEVLGAYRQEAPAISGSERAERTAAARVSANTFDVLGVAPRLGRNFAPAESLPGAEPVVVISDALWQNRFGADPNIVGQTMRVNGRTATIVGVMPAGFGFPDNEELWLPLELNPGASRAVRFGEAVEMFGRLRAGVSRTDAQAELTALAVQMEQDNPITNRDVRPVVALLSQVYLGEQAIALLYTMLGAVFFVLLIACTNVANLLLSRALLRSKEIGIRSALGAARSRIVTQFLAEAFVLCAAGAALGLAIAYGAVRVFNASLEPAFIPFFVNVKIDAVAVRFVLLLALLTTVLAGVFPALRASTSSVTDVLKDDSRGSTSFRLGRVSRALVVFEVALSCGLLVAAGLTTKSIVKLRNVDLGFDSDNLFTGYVSPRESAYTNDQLPQLYDRLAEQLARVPHVESFTLTSGLPGLGSVNLRVGIDGQRYEREQDHPFAMRVAVLPNYWQTLGVNLVEGRSFSAGDRRGSLPVVIVSRAFAQKYFGSQSALGRRVRVVDAQEGTEWMTVVGVAPDLRYEELADASRFEPIFVPLAQQPQPFVALLARTRGSPMAISLDVQRAVAAIDPDLPVFQMLSLRGAIARDTWFFGVFGGLFMIFGIAALILAAIGLYAVMAFSVSQRTREVGIRMALGAQPGTVRLMILREGVGQVSIGMVFGLALAALISRALAVILFDVDARDPAMFGGVVLVLALTALLASVLPARRATSIDPLEALRSE